VRGRRSARLRSHRPGQVFAPNPVADLGIQTLTDQKDADYFSADPKRRKAYHRVTLTNLDGSGTLTGDYAKVLSSTGKAAQDTGSASAPRSRPSTSASSCCAWTSSAATPRSTARAPES
jgi:hypothetical protein